MCAAAAAAARGEGRRAHHIAHGPRRVLVCEALQRRGAHEVAQRAGCALRLHAALTRRSVGGSRRSPQQQPLLLWTSAHSGFSSLSQAAELAGAPGRHDNVGGPDEVRIARRPDPAHASPRPPMSPRRRLIRASAACSCICQNAPNRPGIQEVMDSLERHTVCTGTQCFESEADAFALTAPNSSSGASNATAFWMFLMCAPRHALSSPTHFRRAPPFRPRPRVPPGS